MPKQDFTKHTPAHPRVPAKAPTPPKKDNPQPPGKHDQPFIGPSYKKGGRVKKTGNALVHKGEYVVPAKGGHKKTGRRKKVAKR